MNARRFTACGSFILMGLSTLACHAEPLFSTDPAVSVPVTAPAKTDIVIGMPGHASPAAEAVVTSVVGDILTVSVLDRNPGWSSDRFVANGGQPQSYYVLVMTGAAEGRSYPIEGNTGNTLELDAMGEDLPALIAPGTVVRVIPYWTPARLFPGLEGFAPTGSISGAGATAELLVYSNTPGKNRAADTILYYYDGQLFGGPGWRVKGAGFANTFDHFPIPSDAVLLYRNAGTQAVDLQLTASLQLAGFSTVLGTLEDGQDQDNFVALNVAESFSLEASGLRTHPEFTEALGISGVGGTKVLVYDNEQPGRSKAFKDAYYYYSGPAFGGPGWRKLGGGFFNKFDSEEVFEPGKGYAIRFAGKTPAASSYWSFLPSYLE